MIASGKMKFNSVDGLALRGTVTAPSDAPRALALFCHGITSDRSEWGIFDKAADVLAEVGVASLRFDFRGHGKSRLPSEQITLDGMAGDIAAAWSWLLDAAGGASLPRFVIGSSFGGGLAYRTTDALGAERAFLLAPVFDYLADLVKTAPDWQRQLERKGYFKYSSLKLGGQILEDARAYPAIDAPAALPVTIFHGDQDDDVPIASSARFAATHVECELIEVKGAGHVIAVPGDLDLEEDESWALVDGVIESMRQRITSRLEGGRL